MSFNTSHVPGFANKPFQRAYYSKKNTSENEKSFLYLLPLWRNGRVVECGSLENC